ncbi:protease inhibitor I42 family protein [Streptomyces sp. NPDC001817]|uniref:protease inhibitor I42 family protein n=1 Tax=Streptomyces sp. NPDC001817 TaxID=3154398 RepID=UPI00332B8AE2
MHRPTVARRLAASSLLLLALAGCGLVGGAGHHEYGVQEHSIRVRAGAKFTLSVPADPALGEHWYLADPRPSTRVLRYRGKREDAHGSPKGVEGGGKGTEYFDFTARKKGTTTVKLLHCPMARCSSAAQAAASASPVPTATGTPDGNAAYFLYTVRVR